MACMSGAERVDHRMSKGGGGGQIIFLSEAVNTCFLLTLRKLAAILTKIKCLKNPRWRTCCETVVVIATVLK